MLDQNGDRYKIYEVAENMISLFTILALRLLNNAEEGFVIIPWIV